MKRFFNKLFGNSRTSRPASSARQATRRTMLQMEGLEDRTVPTTLSFNASTSTLTLQGIAPEHSVMLETNGHGQLEVFDNGKMVATFSNIQAVRTTTIIDNDAGVIVNDSNGMPFAQKSTINVEGDGTLELEGSRTVAGDEVYVAGFPNYPGLIELGNGTAPQDDNLNFNLYSGIGVEDFIPITGNLDIQTSGGDVIVETPEVGVAGATAITGLGDGGGAGLVYAHKPSVTLQEFGASATLGIFGPEEAFEQTFTIDLQAPNDTVVFYGTPSGIEINVNADISNYSESVYVGGNASNIHINGSTSTDVTLGSLPSTEGFPNLPSTQGIGADISVNGALNLFVFDNADKTEKTNVNLTPDSISGSGIFANNNVTIEYSGVGHLSFVTGAAAASYTVDTTASAPEFSTPIGIIDDSTSSFSAAVAVDTSSNLNLVLVNQATPAKDTHLTVAYQGDNLERDTIVFSDNGTDNGEAQLESLVRGIKVTGTVDWENFGNVS